MINTVLFMPGGRFLSGYSTKHSPTKAGSDLTEKYMLRSQWTKDVMQYIVLVTLAVSILVLAGVLFHLFSLQATVPFYVFFLITILIWGGGHWSLWQIPNYAPGLLCFGLGILLSFHYGLSTSVIFYGLAIFITGMLDGHTSRWLVLIGSILMMFLPELVYRQNWTSLALSELINNTAGLAGVAIVQWYYDSRVSKILTDRIAVNQILSEEMEHSRLVDHIQTEQEALLERITNHLPYTVADLSPEGIIRYASPSYLNVLGFSSDAIVGTDGTALIHPADLSKAQNMLSISAGQQVTVKSQLRCKQLDGNYIVLEMICSPVISYHGNLEGFVLCGKELNQPDQGIPDASFPALFYQQVVDTLPLGMEFYLLEEDGELILTGYNRAADEILSVRHDEMVGKPFRFLYPDLGGTMIEEYLRKAALEGINWSYQTANSNTLLVNHDLEVTIFQSAPGKATMLYQQLYRPGSEASDAVPV